MIRGAEKKMGTTRVDGKRRTTTTTTTDHRAEDNRPPLDDRTPDSDHLPWRENKVA